MSGSGDIRHNLCDLNRVTSSSCYIMLPPDLKLVPPTHRGGGRGKKSSFPLKECVMLRISSKTHLKGCFCQSFPLPLGAQAAGTKEPNLVPPPLPRPPSHHAVTRCTCEFRRPLAPCRSGWCVLRRSLLPGIPGRSHCEVKTATMSGKASREKPPLLCA